jgi:hypothetical protein
MTLYDRYDEFNGAFQNFVNALYDISGQRLTELVLTEVQYLHVNEQACIMNSYDMIWKVRHPCLYGVPITVKKAESSEPKEFTLLPELGVIVWNAQHDFSCSHRKLAVPCEPKLAVCDLREMNTSEYQAFEYKEYIFERIALPTGKAVYMTRYILGDDVQKSLLK